VPRRFADQQVALALLAQIADQAPGLPPADITIYDHTGGVNVHLSSPDGFERWREALPLHQSAVELYTYSAQAWLAADGRFRGIRVELTADVSVAPALAAVSPQQDAERRARLEQLAAERQRREMAGVAATAVMPLAQALADGTGDGAR